MVLFASPIKPRSLTAEESEIFEPLTHSITFFTLSFGSVWGSCNGSGVQEVKQGVEAIQFVGQPGVVVWDSSTLPLAWSRRLGQQHSSSCDWKLTASPTRRHVRFLWLILASHSARSASCLAFVSDAQSPLLKASSLDMSLAWRLGVNHGWLFGKTFTRRGDTDTSSQKCIYEVTA